VSDESIANRIERLVAEEKELRQREQRDSADTEQLQEDAGRLADVEVELDRCWDLLRQRRALREEGGNPNDAHVRSEDVVERYQQ
jgi:hypothetical protein